MRSGFATPRANSMRATDQDFAPSRPPWRTRERTRLPVLVCCGTSVCVAFDGRSIASCIDSSNYNFANFQRCFGVAADDLRRLAFEAIVDFLVRRDIAVLGQLDQAAGILAQPALQLLIVFVGAR